MGYIDPFQSDAEFINGDSRLSRRQADMDYAEARAKGGFDAALFGRERPTLLPGFRKIPGASRSGALDPQTRSRFERMEQDGSIELHRWHGQMVGYRPLNNIND